jgi:hypothetical protein
MGKRVKLGSCFHQEDCTIYQGEHSIVYVGHNPEGSRLIMRSFLLFQGSRPGLFYDLSAGESRPPRLSGSRWRAGLPPQHSPRKARSCGFPHRHVLKRTAAPRQSRQKRPHAPPDSANYLMLSVAIGQGTPSSIMNHDFAWNLIRGNIGPTPILEISSTHCPTGF